jgi:SAM-dependent methyltransferase
MSSNSAPLPLAHCRFCGAALELTFLDLGETPFANSYPRSALEAERERRYPLRTRVCTRCMLVQTDYTVNPSELFDEYAYFSSYSSSWLDHARSYAELAIERQHLGPEDLVVEVASNDGYLLRYFQGAGIRVLGIDPAANVAQKAIEEGIPTVVTYFGTECASQLVSDGKRADLLIANNVLAHVPDLNDFANGLSILLHPRGVLSIEVPHVLRLIENVEFDTIYHEHYSYFSLLSAEAILSSHGLHVFDVEELPTHGGSLRLWVAHAAAGYDETARKLAVRTKELAAQLDLPQGYEGFSVRVERCRSSVLDFLARASGDGKQVVAYGAAAKGNTLLNYCGVTSSDIAYAVDRNPYKIGRLLPGSHLKIHSPEQIALTKPDYLLILPWNLKDEIREQMGYIRDWGGQIVTPVPEIEFLA